MNKDRIGIAEMPIRQLENSRRTEAHKKVLMKYDRRTREWFANHILETTTVEQCEECGLFYKPSLGHECEVKHDRT